MAGILPPWTSMRVSQCTFILHPLQRIVVNHSSTPRSELFLARASTVKDRIECLVQLHRSIATWIAHDPRAVHDVGCRQPTARVLDQAAGIGPAWAAFCSAVGMPATLLPGFGDPYLATRTDPNWRRADHSKAMPHEGTHRLATACRTPPASLSVIGARLRTCTSRLPRTRPAHRYLCVTGNLVGRAGIAPASLRLKGGSLSR
jgi:hypothetical protein